MNHLALVLTEAPTDPPSHLQLLAVAFILDAVVLVGAVFSLLLIRATARPVCTCERASDPTVRDVRYAGRVT